MSKTTLLRQKSQQAHYHHGIATKLTRVRRHRRQITKAPNNRGTVEFVLAPQHETSCDYEIQTKKDFKKQVHKATWKLADNLIK